MKEGRLDEKESPSGRSQFQFNKKAKNKKRGAFSGGHLFSWGKYMVNISLEQCFLKNTFTNHIKQDIMQSKQRKTTYKTKKNHKNK